MRAAIARLNNLRNDLAHQIDSKGMLNSMRDIASLGATGLRAAGVPVANFKWKVSDFERVNHYRLGVAWIIATLETAARKFRDVKVQA